MKDKHLLLKEQNGDVVFDYVDENDISLKRTIKNMPKPRVRAPRRTLEQIREDSALMASVTHQSEIDYLDNNIRGINNQINIHVQEIRKELKRIQSLTHYVVCVEKILDELTNET